MFDLLGFLGPTDKDQNWHISYIIGPVICFIVLILSRFI